MKSFSASSPVGVAAASASYLVLHALLTQLEIKGVLSARDVVTLLDQAASNIPGKETAAKKEARKLIEDLKVR